MRPIDEGDRERRSGSFEYSSRSFVNGWEDRRVTYMNHDSYRQRIYNSYVHSRAEPLAPEAMAGLKPRAAYLRRLVARHFPQDHQASILELGCGYGALLHFAREAGYTQVSGVDGSPQQVAAARRLGIAGVSEGDLFDTLASLEDASCDCIVTFDVIEHFTREELIPLVDGVFRALKLGGRWIIHTVNGESPWGGRMRYGDVTHELAFTRTSLAQLLLSSGFSQVRSYEDAPIPHGLKSAVRLLLWQGVRAALRFYLLVEAGESGQQAIFSENFLTVAEKKRDEGS